VPSEKTGCHFPTGIFGSLNKRCNLGPTKIYPLEAIKPSTKGVSNSYDCGCILFMRHSRSFEG